MLPTTFPRPGGRKKDRDQVVQRMAGIDEIYLHLDDIAQAARQAACGDRQVQRGKQLITIVTDAPVQLDLDACRLSHFDGTSSKILPRMGFRSLIERLPGESATGAKSPISNRRPTLY